MNRLTHWCVGALALVFAAAGGAQQFVYPAKGQSPQQQQKDEGECHVWAVNQSGFDPAKPPQQAAAKSPTTATGTTPDAGDREPARGAIDGGVDGGDASAVAA